MNPGGSELDFRGGRGWFFFSLKKKFIVGKKKKKELKNDLKLLCNT